MLIRHKTPSIFKTLIVCIVLLVSGLKLNAYSALPIEVDGKQLPSLAPMLEKVQDAVVNISTTSTISQQNHPLFRHPFFRHYFELPEEFSARKRPNSLGSGVIIDSKKGYLVTNYHVIKNADEINVTLSDGRTFSAIIIGQDEKSDLAVIQIDAHELVEMQLGDVRQLRVGDFVVAIGNAFGLSHTVSSGIISGLGRSGLGIESYEDFIQTDASVNPGNSGGALVNLRGELIGINTAILSESGGSIGIGFAIPVDMVANIKDQLIKYGEVRRGLLGVQTQGMDTELAAALDVKNKQGVVILAVYDNSNAKRAGIEVGDIVYKVNNKPIRSRQQLVNAIALVEPGKKAQISLFRDGELIEKSVKIDASSIRDKFFGAQLRDYYNDTIIVENIAPNSPAAQSPLRPNDIIFMVNDTRIHNMREFNRAVNKADERLIVYLLRNGRRFSIEINK